MGQLLENLKRYFDETPADVIKKDMEQFEYLNNIGPDVFVYAESAKSYLGIDLSYKYFDYGMDEIFEEGENDTNSYYLAA